MPMAAATARVHCPGENSGARVGRDSEAAGVVQEQPRDAETGRQFPSQGLHAKGLGRVMASVERVDSPDLRRGQGPVRPSPVMNVSTPSRLACASSDPAPPVQMPIRRQTSDPLGTTGGAPRTRVSRSASRARGMGRARVVCTPINSPPRPAKKGFQSCGIRSAGQLRRISQRRVAIERQVLGVHREVMPDEFPQQFRAPASPRHCPAPEQTVMHQHQIGPGGNGHSDRRQGRIHGGGNFETCPRFSNWRPFTAPS